MGEDRPAESDAYLCTQCIEKLQDLLQDIAEIHERISDVEFLVGTRDKTYQQWMGSKAPCDVYVLSLTDQRSKYLRKGDPVSAHRVLKAWALAVSESLGQVYTGPETVQGYASHLSTFLQWIVRQPACERFARHVSAVAGAMRKVMPKEAA